MSNGMHPMMNAAQGMISSSMGSGLLSSNTLSAQQQHAYNSAVISGSGIYRSVASNPRVFVEVDRVTNGYVLTVGDERMIAKDLEELQQHFIAQVVEKLVLDGDK